MAKKYEQIVEECIECPNCHYNLLKGEHECYVVTGANISVNPQHIPSWCPLEDAEEE